MKLRGIVSLALVSAGMLCMSAMGCKARTPAQKIEDKVDDAGHDINQSMRHAKENVEDATKK